MKRIITKILYVLMGLNGFKGYSGSLMLKAFKKDLLDKNIPFRIKLWSWRRGFISSRVYTYGINEKNYRNHMPDFDYYKLHPINGIYSKWIDDKLTMKYLLIPFDEYLPKYYFQIKKGGVFKLMDCPDGFSNDPRGIINLLKVKDNLVLKQISGSLGKGFYKLSYRNGDYFVNEKLVVSDDIIGLIEKLDKYIITEYIIAHRRIAQIYSSTPNTLRVQMVKDGDKDPKITGGFMRFGTEKSGVLEIAAAGTIFAGVNFDNGQIYNPMRKNNCGLESIRFHPDTNAKLEIELPNWDIIKNVIFDISKYLPQLSYLGFDIIITDCGFKIIEINSLSALTFLPYFYPFFEDGYCRNFFLSKFNKNAMAFKRILRTLGH